MSETKHVLALVGSPRIGGNTECLVDEVLRGASDTGAKVDRIMLSQRRIGPCLACDGCITTGQCVQQDDMEGLLEAMAHSDVWVFGTPVYWWGPTAQFKTFIDRWYAPWHNPTTRTVFDNRRVVLVVTMGDTDPTTADATVEMIERSFSFLGMPKPDIVLAPGVHDRGEAANNDELMKRAHGAGRRAVSS